MHIQSYFDLFTIWSVFNKRSHLPSSRCWERFITAIIFSARVATWPNIINTKSHIVIPIQIDSILIFLALRYGLFDIIFANIIEFFVFLVMSTNRFETIQIDGGNEIQIVPSQENLYFGIILLISIQKFKHWVYHHLDRIKLSRVVTSINKHGGFVFITIAYL